jgi:uncharacterized BrkB/YihY/UPF0761 family membrane protein
MVKARFWSFTLVVGIGFLLLVSLIVSAWLAALGTYVSYLLPAPAWALETLNFLISLAVITGAFAVIFKLLPDVKIAWRDVWLGAAATSLFFKAPSWSSWCGCTTRRRSCCSARSSRRSGRSAAARASRWTRARSR